MFKKYLDLVFKKKVKVDNVLIGVYRDKGIIGNHKYSLVLLKNQNNVKTGEYDNSRMKKNVILKLEIPSVAVVDVLLNQLSILRNEVAKDDTWRQ